jgi:glycosyltransferase involved in cell wall biosynthesis
MRPFILCSEYFAPSVGGTQTVLRNLLSEFVEGEYFIVAGSQLRVGDYSVAGMTSRVIRMPIRSHIARKVFRKVSIGIADRLFGLLKIRRAKRIITRVAKTQNAFCIVGVIPGIEMAIAAFLASKKLKIPFYIYYVDTTMRYLGISKWNGFLLDSYERQWLIFARRVFVISESLAEDLRLRLKYPRPMIMRHCLPVSEFENTISLRTGRKPGDPSQALFAGHLKLFSKAKLFNVIVQAIEIVSKSKPVRLEILGMPTRESVTTLGIADSPLWTTAIVTREESLRRQKNADILIDVLDCSGDLAEIMKTAFPTKIVEYMVSGTPILFVAASDSFASAYLRKYDLACVVDSSDPDYIAEKIESLLCDQSLRRRLINNAFNTAKANHNAGAISKMFRKCLLNGIEN